MESLVLSDAFTEALDGRRVLYALFTTYAFSPDHFETKVLPLLVDRAYSKDPQIIRVQLSESLRSVAGIEVYYDYGAQGDNSSCHLDYVRAPIHLPKASFHPKVVLLLVKDEDGNQSLLVGAGSANLTVSGYSDNVECWHFEELKPGMRSPFRGGLVDFLKGLQNVDRTAKKTGAERPARKAIRQFITKELRDSNDRQGFYSTAPGLTYSFLDFLADCVGSRRGPWNMEIVSPFFAQDGGGGLVDELGEYFGDYLRKLNVYLPVNEKGQAQIKEDVFTNIAKTKWAQWCAFKDASVLSRGKKGANPRTVHAKVYRLYDRTVGEEYVFVGSVNFTRKGMALTKPSNFESGFLIRSSKPDFQPLLESIDKEPTRFDEKLEPAPGEGYEENPFLGLRYDWRSGVLEALGDGSQSQKIRISDAQGSLGQNYSIPATDSKWTSLSLSKERLEKHLKIQSLINVAWVDKKGGTKSQKEVLVQEMGMSSRPPLLAELSPKQILKLWTILDSEEKTEYLEKLCQLGLTNILPEHRAMALGKEDTGFFSQFAQTFQSFNRLSAHFNKALEEENQREYEYYLFGKDIDSLLSLLKSVSNDESMEKVTRYLIGLCANGVLNNQKAEVKQWEFPHRIFTENKGTLVELENAISTLMGLKASLDLAHLETRADEFFEWYEKSFMTPAALEKK